MRISIIVTLFVAFTTFTYAEKNRNPIKKDREKRTVGIILGSIVKGLILKDAVLQLLVNATANATQSGNMTQQQQQPGQSSTPGSSSMTPPSSSSSSSTISSGKKSRKGKTKAISATPPPPPPPEDDDSDDDDEDEGTDTTEDSTTEDDDQDNTTTAEDRLDVNVDDDSNTGAGPNSNSITFGNEDEQINPNGQNRFSSFTNQFIIPQGQQQQPAQSYVRTSNGYEFTNYHGQNHHQFNGSPDKSSSYPSFRQHFADYSHNFDPYNQEYNHFYHYKKK